MSSSKGKQRATRTPQGTASADRSNSAQSAAAPAPTTPPPAPVPTTPPPTSEEIVFRTPVTNKLGSTVNDYKRPDYAVDALTDEMDPIISFVKLALFMAKHVPGKDLSKALLAKIGRFSMTSLELEGDEKLMYVPIITVIMALFKQMGLPYIALATGAWIESSKDDMKPDICVYGTGPDGGQAAWQLSQDELAPIPGQPPWKDDLRAAGGRTAWAWIVTVIEVKNSSTNAPFVQKDGEWVLADHRQGMESRAQMTRYATEIQLRQHRKFLFSVCIWRHLAWLMRWDRAGVIITDPIDYVKDPTPLLNFLYRVHSSSKFAQGFDTSASLASPAHVELFTKHVQSLPEGTKRNYGLDALSEPLKYPIYAVKCPDVEWMNLLDERMRPPSGRTRSQKTNLYLIGKFRFGTRSPTGRGGKGYIAYDVDRGRLVFLKDYWCARAKGVHPELSIYKILKAQKIKYVATAIAGGDVADQVTASQEHPTRSSLRPAERFHHRVVLWEIGRPLETYSRGGHLVVYVHQAATAHRDAWTNAQILHRDVSMGNILIDIDEGKAFLNDWDLCKFERELLDGATQHDRSGTWIYMSGTLLQYPKKLNELADDVESFVYVISIALLRFHAHSLSGDRVTLAQHITTKYETAVKAAGDYVIGGRDKVRDMLEGNPGFKLVEEEGGPKRMSALLTKLYQLGQNHYRNLDLEDLQRKYGASPPEDMPQMERLAEVDETEEPADSYWADLGPGSDDEDAANAPAGHTATDIYAASAGPSAGPNAGPNVGPSAWDDPFAPVSRPSGGNITPGTPRVTGDFNSHGPLLDILAGRGDKTWKQRWPNDKVQDQFSGIGHWAHAESKGSTGSSRRSFSTRSRQAAASSSSRLDTVHEDAS